MGYALLDHRGIIKVSGEDKFGFLQGLITQDLRLLTPGRLLYSCFLTPQGKFLADFFIREEEQAWLIDIDKTLLSDFLKRLSIYKLRSRVMLAEVSDQYQVHAFWGVKPDWPQVYEDPRFPGAGWRAIAPREAPLFESQGDYVLWQLQNGLPDKDDFIRERTSMLEANMDLLNALSWNKGCYMGQELTARTHYRGLVKKRMLPIRFERNVSVSADAPVTKDGKTIGYTRSQRADCAIAVLQLEGLRDNDAANVAGEWATVVFPKWFGLPGNSGSVF